MSSEALPESSHSGADALRVKESLQEFPVGIMLKMVSSCAGGFMRQPLSVPTGARSVIRRTPLISVRSFSNKTALEKWRHESIKRNKEAPEDSVSCGIGEADIPGSVMDSNAESLSGALDAWEKSGYYDYMDQQRKNGWKT